MVRGNGGRQRTDPEREHWGGQQGLAHQEVQRESVEELAEARTGGGEEAKRLARGVSRARVRELKRELNEQRSKRRSAHRSSLSLRTPSCKLTTPRCIPTPNSPTPPHTPTSHLQGSRGCSTVTGARWGPPRSTPAVGACQAGGASECHCELCIEDCTGRIPRLPSPFLPSPPPRTRPLLLC